MIQLISWGEAPKLTNYRAGVSRDDVSSKGGAPRDRDIDELTTGCGSSRWVS